MNDTSLDEPLVADGEANSIPTPNSSTHGADQRFLAAATLFFGVLVVSNAAFGPLTVVAGPSGWTAPLAFMSGGCLLSQLGLLAAWNVWAPLNYLRRVAIGWGIAAALAGVWAVGKIVARLATYGDMDVQDPFPLLFFPLVSVIFESPLWALKTLFEARFVRSGDAPDRPLAISDLLMGMFVAGVALALARLAHHLMNIDSDMEFWAAFAVISGIGGGVGVMILPALALTATRFRSWVASAAITTLTVLALGTGSLGIAFLVLGMPPNRNLSGLLASFFMPASAAATIAAAFGVARLAGYRFQFGKLRSKQSSADQEHR